MAKQFGKTAKMAGGGNTSMMPDGALIDKLYAALSGSGQSAQPASILYQRIKRANPGMSDAEAMQLAGMASQPQAVAPSAAASGPVANQQPVANTQAPQAMANAVRATQPQIQANVPGVPGLPQSSPMGLSGPLRPPIDSTAATAAMAAMAQQAAPPSAPLNLPPPRMPSSPQGSLPMPSMPAAAQPQITGSGEEYALPAGATPPFVPSGKGKVNWRDFLEKALMSGAGGMAIGASGINPIAGAGLGALVPLLMQLAKKKKKTETTEKKAKGGAVSSKKSGKKFGGSKKAAPKKPVHAEPDGDEQMMMPPGMPPGMMKKGGCVKKMASGGLVSRGMGAARGGSFKSY